MGDVRRAVGTQGEALAARWLGARGMRVVEQGYRCRLGEIDIVAWDGDVLVFCEVKARRSMRCGSPEEAVTPLKQARLRRLAETYMASHGLTAARARFDVVGVWAPPDTEPQVRHIPNAF